MPIIETIATKKCVIDDDYTINKRVVKLDDGSGLYQLHVSTCEDFRRYRSITFATRNAAIKRMKQL